MKKSVSLLLCMLLLTTSGALADWDPEDGHKMHHPQLPDVDGWDVYATSGVPGWPNIVLADDWRCSESGPVSDIHFWGSWLQGTEGDIDFFKISIHEDIPANPPDVPYSRPGKILWEREIQDWQTRAYDSPGQGFFYPYNGEVLDNDHQQYFQYNIMDIPEPLYQEEGKIYWLAITAFVKESEPGTFQPLWGWKNSEDHWNDDACWSRLDEIEWVDMWEPQPPPITNEFWITFDPMGNFLEGGGTDFFGEGWYFYPESKWWNIWFYDHPFDPGRYKELFVMFDIRPLNPDMPMFVDFAVNWATDQWPPGEDPPIPPVDDEDLVIGREILISGPDVEGHYEFHYTIEAYNPEWVSVDVRGYNFVIENGILTHECLPNDPVSLDLAFVINGKTPIPDLDCKGKLSWVDIKPEETVTATIYVENIGDPGSQLDWSVCSWPSWGTWTFSPSSGTDLTPADGQIPITVTVVAPNQQNEEFTGNVTLCNDENAADTCTIPVSLTTPRNSPVSHPFILSVFTWLLERFPALQYLPIIQQLSTRIS